MNGRQLLSFAIGPVLAAGLGALTVPLLAWLFAPDDVGRFGVLQTTVALVLTGVMLGLDQAYVREYHELPDRRALFATTTRLPYLVLGGVTLIAVILSQRIALVLYGEPVWTWTVATLGCVWAALLLRQWMLVVRMEERGLVFSLAQSLPRAVLVILALALPLLSIPAGYGELQVIFLISSLVCLIPLGIATRRTWFPPQRGLARGMLLQLLAYSVPLALAAFLYAALAAAGVYTLRATSSLAEVATYSVAVSAAGVAVVLQTIFSVVWAPILYRSASVGADRPLVLRARNSMLAIVCAAFALCGMLSWLLDYLLPADYAQVRLLVLVTVAQPLLYVLSEVTGAGVGITRRSGFALLATAIAVVACAGLNLVLTPQLGARGAALSAMLAFWLLFVLKTEASAAIWVDLPRWRLHLLVAAWIGLAAVTVLVAPGPAITAAAWGMLGVVSAVACWREWVWIARRIRPRGRQA